MKAMLWCCIYIIALGVNSPHAQFPLHTTDKKAANTSQPKIQIEELDWVDRNHLEQQALRINELAQGKLGVSIRRDLHDLDTLQRIIDTKLVAPDDYKTLQAMGVVLGNVMRADFPTALEWKIYRDEAGRSRALCVHTTANCLFPVTMLERRMESGIHPDVKKIYHDAILSMEQHLPRLPYGGGLMYKLPR